MASIIMLANIKGCLVYTNKEIVSKIVSEMLKNERYRRSIETRCGRVIPYPQEKMAINVIGMTVSEYQALEQQKVKDPRLSTFLQICYRLGWSIDQPFGLVKFRKKEIPPVPANLFIP